MENVMKKPSKKAESKFVTFLKKYWGQIFVIIILLIFFHKHLKTEKSHLAHGLHKTRQQAEFIPRSTVVCQPLLDDTEIDLSSFLLSGN